MIECTYVSSDISTQLAQERGHIHLADLAKRAPLLQAETIVLMVPSRLPSVPTPLPLSDER